MSTEQPVVGISQAVALLDSFSLLSAAVESSNDTALHGKPISGLRSVICHVGSRSVTCHPTQVNVRHLNPSQSAGSRFTYPGGIKAELTLVLVIYLNGLPVRRQSPIQVLTI